MRCLFTGTELGVGAPLEHAIPRALGGRVTARNTHGLFNHAAGRVLDEPLAGAYVWVLNTLGPLLGANNRPSRIPVIGEESGRKYILDRRGETTTPNVQILRRDRTGRPVEWTGTERQTTEFARQMGLDLHSLQRQETQLVPDKILLGQAETPLISAELECAVLKSMLLVWDAMLDGAFVRTEATSNIRELVSRTVSAGRVVDLNPLGRHFLGVSMDVELREVLLNECRVNPSPFEHVLGVWTTGANQTVECAWSVLGVDVFTARLSDRWTGGQFAWIAGCGTTVGTHSFGPIEAPRLHRLGLLPTTPFRSISHPSATPTEMEIYFRPILSDREKAVRRAVSLVEHSADDHVGRCLCNHARLVESETGEGALASDAIRRRLQVLYLKRDHSHPEDEIAAAVSAASRAFPSLSERLSSATPAVLAAYRMALSALERSVGPPGLVFSERLTGSQVEHAT